ncbi:disco-interacting protein 2 homolog B-like [Salvelinus sp. IW2-2015]|uniref:disco-interacting protein 2 homolog B-like n=1 Tax=Salvelinus sp. IW2-2015 TaxID=2691554 RepID=UPI0038D4B83C
MAERNSTGLLMMLEPTPAIAMTLPVEVREKLAELELELSEGDITQKGYEKKRAKLLAPYTPQIQEPSLQKENRIQMLSQAAHTGSPPTSLGHQHPG